MNRIIKFRAKPLEEEYNFFVYGSLKLTGGTYDIVEPEMTHEDAYDYPTWEINEETIGQFTGLTDKNGIEIYDGDILRSDYAYTQFFEIHFQQARFKALLIGRIDDGQILGTGLWSESEIVGNIYDNKELINGDS